MAEFVINTEVVTKESTIEVTVNREKPLPLGRHTFRLIVVDDAGNKSIPDEIQVIVADQQNPTAVLVGPKIAAFGASFPLDGSRSFDVGGGSVVRYEWTYLGQA
jgi:hypothetical protein